MKKVLLALICAFALAAGAALFAAVPEPLGITNGAMGGGRLNDYTPGVDGGVGLNNIGLLVRVWGRVTYVDPTEPFCYMDDGSARDDQSGWTGVRVAYNGLAPGNTFSPPSLNQYVVITGISSTSVIQVAGQPRVIPALRPRRQTDMSVLQ